MNWKTAMQRLVASKALAKLRKYNISKCDFTFLEELEREVILRRIAGKTHEEIGKELRISPERTWQIERRACNRAVWFLSRNPKYCS